MKRRDPRSKRSKKFHVPMVGGTAISQAKPWKSLGMGCSSRQVKEFNDFYQENGITGAYHEPDGTCVATSRKARNQVLKLRNMRDNDAGYGDWSGIN